MLLSPHEEERMDTIKAVANWLVNEGRVIADAPVAFLVSVGVIGSLLYFGIKAFFKERMEVLEQRRQHAQDEADAYKNKLQGATPEEAAQAIRELQSRVRALEPRRLTDEQRRAMREVLGRFAGTPVIEVAYDGACADARGYQVDLVRVLAEVGWQVSSPMVIGVGLHPPSGLAVCVPTAAAAPEATSLTDALRAAKIEFDLYKNRPLGVSVVITTSSRR